MEPVGVVVNAVVIPLFDALKDDVLMNGSLKPSACNRFFRVSRMAHGNAMVRRWRSFTLAGLPFRNAWWCFNAGCYRYIPQPMIIAVTDLLKALLHEYGILTVSLSKLEVNGPPTRMSP